MEPLDCICRFLDEDYDGLDEDEDQLFSLRPIRDEWRQLFDKYDPEGFGEIPLDDFEVALETRDFLEAISPGKLIILQVNLMFTFRRKLESKKCIYYFSTILQSLMNAQLNFCNTKMTKNFHFSLGFFPLVFEVLREADYLDALLGTV